MIPLASRIAPIPASTPAASDHQGRDLRRAVDILTTARDVG